MFDHIAFSVTDFARSRAFYVATLTTLGIELAFEQEGEILGFRADGESFYVGFGRTPTSGRVHYAFKAASTAQVDAFHAAGLAAGGTDNGAPGIRERYAPNYYAAFVLDPDGHNIEAVHRLPTDD